LLKWLWSINIDVQPQKNADSANGFYPQNEKRWVSPKIIADTMGGYKLSCAYLSFHAYIIILIIIRRIRMIIIRIRI
jgi:hypothetical protein